MYKSEILAAVHETALGLREAGILNKVPMKTFDEMCLAPVGALTPEQTDTANPITRADSSGHLC